MPPPLDKTVREAILEDIRAGKLSARAIAKAHGVGVSTVSRLAAKEHVGDRWERSKTRTATRAREADNAARRSALAARRLDLAEALHDDAQRLRAQLWQPQEYFDWGGKDHDFDTHTTPEPTPSDKRALMGAAAVAVDKSLKLVPPTDEAGTEAAASMLGALAAGIRHFAETAEQEEADGEG